MDRVDPQAAGPIGVTRASTASLPAGAPGVPACAPGGGEPVMAVGDHRAGAPGAPRSARSSRAGSVTRHSRCRTPSASVELQVGGATRAAGGQLRHRRVRVVRQHDRLQVGARWPPAVPAGPRPRRDRCPRAAAPRPTRAAAASPRPASPGGRRAVGGRISYSHSAGLVVPDRAHRRPASGRAWRPPVAAEPAAASRAVRHPPAGSTRGRMRRTMLCGSASASRSRPAGVTRS